MSDRVPPCDIEAERAVVGACLISPESLAIVRDQIRPDQLVDVKSRLVLESVYALDDTGSKVDPVTLMTSMRSSGKLNQIGGSGALVELFSASPDIGNVSEHASIVESKHRLRRIIDTCKVHVVMAYGDIGSIDDYCAKVESDIMNATDPGQRDDGPQTIGEIIRQELPNITDRQSGKVVDAGKKTKTGIFELDQMTKGGLSNNLYVIAGRPGQGKSVLVNTLCLQAAKDGRSSVLESLEMPKDQLGFRLLASASGVPFDVIESERMSEEQWRDVLNASELLSKIPLSIQFRPGAHISQIRSTFRREFARLRRMFGTEPGMCAIDYAQLVEGNRPKGATRDEEVGSITRACMKFPHEFECPCVLLSQLNREIEKRPNKRPQLSDLRESGAIEQDAFAVLGLYRDAYYHPETEDKDSAEIIVMKNRNGSTGTIMSRFDGPTMRFYSYVSEMRRATDQMTDDFSDGF